MGCTCVDLFHEDLRFFRATRQRQQAPLFDAKSDTALSLNVNAQNKDIKWEISGRRHGVSKTNLCFQSHFWGAF